MKLKEIQDWIKNSQYVDSTDYHHDSCDNIEETRIYRNNGKLYKIEFMNDYPYEKWAVNDKGRGYFVRGEYSDPIEVIMKTQMVEQIYYENV